MAFCNKTRGTGKKPKTPSPMTTRVVLLFVVLVIVPFFIMAAFVVRIFRDYNITTLGTSAMDSMSSVGYQISGGLKSRMESSLFAYYNDVVELLSGEELTEREEKLIEKRLTSNVYSTDGVAAGAIIDRNGKVYGVGNYSWAVGLFVEAADGHDRKNLVDSPRIGQRLEEGEVAEVLVRQHFGDFFQFLGCVF